jgi:protein-L-isoaspartate(D-aspartate) O-methyltransferase
MTESGDRPDYATFVNRLADELVAKGAITTAPVEHAFRTVPRHLFIDRANVYFGEEPHWREVFSDHQHPDSAVLDRIYRNSVIQLGESSTSSEPGCMAWMLEDLGLRPGMKVFEVGTASGWNAALLAEIVGDPSLVYSIEVDAELAQSAKRHLEEAGYGGVTVVAGDGAKGYAPRAPYDAIIGTCGCTDLAPAWVEQLSEGGVMLVPLHIAPSGDPTLLVRRSAEGLRGRFTRLIYFVACQSDLIACPVLPESLDISEALKLGTNEAGEQAFISGLSPDDRNSWWSLFVFFSLHMGPHQRVVTAHGFFPLGIADAANREAWILTDDLTRIRAIGGAQLLEQFMQIARRWEGLGRPLIRDFAVTVVPAGAVAQAPRNGGILSRRYYDYLVSIGTQ